MSETVSCQTCGRLVGKDDGFCPGCGSSMTGAQTATGMYSPAPDTNPTQCVQCSAPMGREDRFCKNCGASRPEEATVVSHVSLQNAQAARLIESTHGEFEVVQQLGHGAMGSVYLARDTALSRRVAIKVIAANLLSDETMVSRFRLEAQTVASLRHPNIVNIHGVRQADDLHYFVMEFIDGPNLRSVIKRHAPLAAEVVKGILFQVGSALSYAHRAGGGVIHRDIKPANIMVNQEGDAFVTDFGISKIAETQTGLTQTGATIGTPEYMSPEQCRGETLTGASDQYALGIVAYEMLTGSTPFSGSHYVIMMAHTQEPPKSIRQINPACPSEVAEAVERMLAKSPAERWPDLHDAVKAMGGAPMSYQDPTRTKIVALIESTEGEVSPVASAAPAGVSGQGTVPDTAPGTLEDTATSVTVTGLPSRVEAGDSFALEASVMGPGDAPLTGLGVEWSSTDPSIARVTGGEVQVLKAGSVSISAAVGDVANSVLLTVAEPAVASVRVRPASVTIQKGGRMGLSALLQDGRGEGVEKPVRWSSSDETVATVTAEGQVVAVEGGSVTVTAECDGVSGTARVEVEVETAAAAPASKPKAAPSRPRRARQPAAAAAVPWFRRPVVVISSIGAIIVLGFGISSVLGPAGPTPASDLTERIELSSPNDTVAVGASVQLAAAAFGAGNEPLTDATIDWTSDAPSVASVNASGLLMALAEGMVSVTAALDGITATTTVFIAGPATVAAGQDDPESQVVDGGAEDPAPIQQDPAPQQTVVEREPEPTTTRPAPSRPSAAPTPAAVSIRIPATSMQVGAQQSPTAQVRDRAGNLIPRSPVMWSSTSGAVISVSAQSGALRAVGEGSAYVVARAGNARDSVLVSAMLPVARVQIEGGDLRLAQGAAEVLRLSVSGPNGEPLDRDVAWNSSNRSVAVVAPDGLVSAVSSGTAQISAVVEGVGAQITLTVEAGTPTPPTAAEVTSQLEAYLEAMQSDRDATMALWPEGMGDEDLRGDFEDLLGRPDFSAELDTQAEPILEGSVASVALTVSARYRANFGRTRSGSVNLIARFESVGAGWRLASVVAESIDDL